MNLGDFLVSLAEIIVGRASVEMDGDRVLTGGDFNDRRRRREERLVEGEIGNSQGGGHDDDSEGLHE